MAKFTGLDDEGYKKVSGVIEGYVDDITENRSDNNHRAIASSGHAANDTSSKLETLLLAVRGLVRF